MCIAMFRKLVILIASIIAFELVISQENEIHSVQYSAETYPVGMAKNYNFVMFYESWCPHYKRLSPTWEELAQRENGREEGRVRIAKVNCETDGTLCSGIRSIPTIKFFEPGNSEGTEYTGGRSLQSLTRFIDQQLSNITVISTTPSSTTESARIVELI